MPFDAVAADGFSPQNNLSGWVVNNYHGGVSFKALLVYGLITPVGILERSWALTWLIEGTNNGFRQEHEKK